MKESEYLKKTAKETLLDTRGSEALTIYPESDEANSFMRDMHRLQAATPPKEEKIINK